MEFTCHYSVYQVFRLVLVRDCLMLGLCLGLARWVLGLMLEFEGHVGPLGLGLGRLTLVLTNNTS